MSTDKNFLPFHRPSIGEEEVEEVVEVLRSGWLTTGEKTHRFENEFKDFIGGSHALAVNSATAGLHLSLEAVGISSGDKVITSPYTFTATAEVIRYLGAHPIFVDIDPLTFNLNPNNVVSALKRYSGVKAILPVHFGGQACNMDAIVEIAHEYDLRIIEDAAHALPATYNEQMIGTVGDLTVFSFYVTKTLATGEGGMVVTNNPTYCDRIRVMRLHGIDQDVYNRGDRGKPSWYYEVIAPGYKYNMTDLAAAIGIHQLKKVRAFQKRREAIAKMYESALFHCPLKLPQKERPQDLHSWHLYMIQLDLDRLTIERDKFIELMGDAGVGVSVHFIPLYLHPYWRDQYQLKPEDFPQSSIVYRQAVSLPIYPAMSDSDVHWVIDAVKHITEKYS